MKKTIEELLQTPYWIIDILPKQVPKDSLGQYFPIEDYFLRGDTLAAIKQKHLNLILKLNCYRDVSLDEDEERNPPPEQIADTVFRRYTYIRMADAMGYKTIFWSVAYKDWDTKAQPTHEKAMNYLTTRIHPGAIILLHAVSKTNTEILDQLLTRWKEMGYTFKTLDDLPETLTY